MRTGSLWVVGVVLGGLTACFFDENYTEEVVHIVVSAGTQRDLADQFPLVVRTEVWSVEPTDDPRVESAWLLDEQRSILCRPSRFDVTVEHSWGGIGNCADPDRITVSLERAGGLDAEACTDSPGWEEYTPRPLDHPVVLEFDHPIECEWRGGESGYDFWVAPL